MSEQLASDGAEDARCFGVHLRNRFEGIPLFAFIGWGRHEDLWCRLEVSYALLGRNSERTVQVRQPASLALQYIWYLDPLM